MFMYPKHKSISSILKSSFRQKIAFKISLTNLLRCILLTTAFMILLIHIFKKKLKETVHLQ